MTIIFAVILGVFFFVALFVLTVYLLLFVPLRKKEPGFEYVYVEEDGTVRELNNEEKEYLSANFDGPDSGRPYIKFRYSSLTPDKKIGGYIERRRVPQRINIEPSDT